MASDRKGDGNRPGDPDEGADRRERDDQPRPGARYSRFVGLAFLALVVFAALNTLRTEEGSVLGTEEVRGEALAEFAVPDIGGSLDADANVAQDDCEIAQNPCPEGRERVPACRIEGQDAIRVCDLFDRPLVISFWFTTPEGCPPTQDAVDRLARRYRGRVNFLSIAVRGERAEIERIVAQRGWTLPVGWDRDGAVSNIYRVGVCPTAALAYPGGLLHHAVTGAEALSVEALDAAVRRLLRESRDRARTDR